MVFRSDVDVDIGDIRMLFKPRLVEESVENIALPKVDKHSPPLRLVVDEERNWGFPEENPRVPTLVAEAILNPKLGEKNTSSIGCFILHLSDETGYGGAFLKISLLH